MDASFGTYIAIVSQNYLQSDGPARPPKSDHPGIPEVLRLLLVRV